MADNHPAAPPSVLSERPPIRYYPISNSETAPILRELSHGEAYVVPNFEVAEELIVRGADSARIAVNQLRRRSTRRALSACRGSTPRPDRAV